MTPAPWHRRIAVPVRLTPPCPAVHTTIGAIVVGLGWTSCVPTALPVAAPGVSSVVLGTQLASEQVLEAYRVWRLTEVLLSHVLPWRQAQIV